MRRALAIALALAAVALAIALVATIAIPAPPPPPSPSASVIARALSARIVVSVPLGGARHAQSEGIANALQLALEEVNSRVQAGDASITLELVVHDSSGADGAWSEAVEKAIADRAANDRSVIAYVGPSTIDGAKAVAPSLASTGLLAVTPVVTHPALTRRGYDDALYDALHPGGAAPFVRTIPSDAVSLGAMARWAKDRGLTPVFAQSDGSAYGESMWNAFVGVARQSGIETADPRDPRIKFLYVGGESGAKLGERVAALRRDRRTLAVGGGEAMLSDAFLREAGPAAEGTVATFAGRPQERYSGRAGAFFRAYRDRFLFAPDPYAIFGYDAAQLILDAIQRSPQGAIIDRNAVREAALATRELDGALGRWGVDAHGDTTYATLQLYAVRALPGGTLAWVWESEIRP